MMTDLGEPLMKEQLKEVNYISPLFMTIRQLTLVLTFSNEGGLISEKQHKKTSV